MALKPIVEMVRERLPWLTVADNPTIQAALEEQFVVLQPWTKLSDLASEIETNYTKMQCLLLKELTAYQLVILKAAQTVGGTGAAGGGAAGRVVKRVKADVVETEFESVKLSDGTSIALNTSSLLDEIRKAACGYARTLGYELALCGAVDPDGEAAGPIPFITLTDVGYWPGAPLGCYLP
jgi:hypothetical protein